MGCDKTELEDQEFETYTIPTGEQRSTRKIRLMSKKELKFIVQFDSSAVYTSLESINQSASNKLFGFSDCNTEHQQNSARFGWRWLNSKLEILTYCYNDSERLMQYLTTLEIGTAYECSIKIKKENYFFSINGATAMVQRGCSESRLRYYLYPYFGGTENAPHDINIKIKE